MPISLLLTLPSFAFAYVRMCVSVRATQGSSIHLQYPSDECVAILLNNSLGGRRVKAELVLQGHGPVAHRLLERLLLNHVIVCV